MSTHLRPEELVDAVEGTLDRARAAHAAGCLTCADEIARLTLLMRDVEAAGVVPEPSPLFWDHLTARVRREAETPARAARWWSPSARSTFGLAATALAAIALMLIVRPPTPRDARAPTDVARTAATDIWLPPLEESPWDVMLGLAGDLSWEDVNQAAMPRTGTADTLIEELTPAEREQFVRLLRREIGDLE